MEMDKRVDGKLKVTEPIQERSTFELIGDIGPQVSKLIKEEVALAKAELKSDIKREIRMAKLMGIGALLAIFGVAMLFVTIAMALATTLPAWFAALIVAVVLFAGAVITAGIGWSKRVKKPLDTTQQSIKEDIEWVKEDIK